MIPPSPQEHLLRYASVGMLDRHAAECTGPGPPPTYSIMDIPVAMRDALSRAIDEAATDFVFLTDACPIGEGGPHIIYVNQAMLRAFGYESAAVVGKSPSVFWGPETDMEAVARLRSTIGQLREAGGEFAAYRRDGSMLWVHFRGKMLELDGMPAHWIALGCDITEMRRQCAQIAELSRFQGDLIAMLAHDFRGPLTAVAGFAELLIENAGLSSPERSEMLSTIRREAQRLANFAADTLTVSRMESESLTIVPLRFDLAQMVREVADLYADRGVLALHLPESLEVEADPARMRQVIDNLIGNAVKYSAPDSPVVVELATDEADVLTFAVRDRGIGIPADEVAHVFERYARASNARAKGISGTGFGLYLCEAIIRHHGGRIDVQTRLNEGSTFTVRMPRRAASTVRVLRAAAPTA